MRSRIRSESYTDKVAIAANQNVKERKYWLNQLSGDFVKSRFPYDLKKENENPKVEAIIQAVENQNYPVELFPGLLNLPFPGIKKLSFIRENI